ncbi:MAG: aldehyde dehydrogenase family protein [Mariniblastus sp.]|nr:aldehyde dehydrogenase family protein [Mariniblastus sp.]
MANHIESLLTKLKVQDPLCGVSCGGIWQPGAGESLAVFSPIDRKTLAELTTATSEQTDQAIASAAKAFVDFRTLPAPRRGELVRQFGEQLRAHQAELGQLVTLETGKITAEALGEVQEMIDICDFAVGLSRQLYGKTMASERAGHRLAEQWHPLGPVGVISAFNFPVAVWAWNAAIAWVCGDPVVWKPSEKTPLTAVACQSLLETVVAEFDDIPPGISQLVVGGAEIGKQLAADSRLPLVSATGSVPMGRAVAVTVAQRLGRSLLELGGNNGMIVSPSADLELAVRSITFSAVGTCGQRCTTLRRLMVHESIADDLVHRLRKVYENLPIGDPTDPATLVGPLVDARAGAAMERALTEARLQGGKVHGGNQLTKGVPNGGIYVQPALVEIASDAPILQEETFAPILYVTRYNDLNSAIRVHNDVPQGLSSAILTCDAAEAETFCSAAGSDCGIVNVNIGTSGAEIGGAFGGEKETGGGRESGSDAWKTYMRRATNTVNYSGKLPLAQGIRFDV